MSADEAIDRMAEIVEHHHPIEQPRWFGSRPKSIIPKPFHNTKNQEFSPKPVHYPKTKEEIQDLDSKFRCVGSGHSFRNVLETEGILISIEDMNKVIKVEGNIVTVEAGIKIRDAIRILEKKGLALKNMGNYDRQSIGGAICGGTHGTTGQGRFDTFTSSIVSFKMINAKGEDVELGPEESVNFGIGGIIYEVTLELVPFYYLEEKRTPIQDPTNFDFNSWWESSALFSVSCMR